MQCNQNPMSTPLHPEDGNMTPKAGRIRTRANNTTKHPGDAQNTYMQKR